MGRLEIRNQHLRDRFTALRTSGLTVTQNKLGKTGNDHGDASEEVVVGTQANEGVWRYCALELAEREDGAGVWDEEAEEAEQTWVGWAKSV